MLLLKKYGLEIMIGVLVIMVSGYIGYQKVTINSLEKDKLVLQSRIEGQKALILAQSTAALANRADYKFAIQRLPTVLHDIETRYKTQYETIYSWRDHNVTHDCNSSMQYLNAYQF